MEHGSYVKPTSDGLESLEIDQCLYAQHLDLPKLNVIGSPDTSKNIAHLIAT